MCDVTLCRDSRYIKKYVLCVYFSYAVGCSAVGCSAVGLSSLVFNSVVLPKPITTCLSAHCWSARLLHICIRASSFSVFVQAFVDVLIIISYSFDVFCSHFSVELVLFLFNVCMCVYIWKKMYRSSSLTFISVCDCVCVLKWAKRENQDNNNTNKKEFQYVRGTFLFRLLITRMLDSHTHAHIHTYHYHTSLQSKQTIFILLSLVLFFSALSSWLSAFFKNCLNGEDSWWFHF